MSNADVTSLGLKPLYSFEQLVVGPNNEMAAAACHAVVQSPGTTYNPLFIFGPSGVGKTHLIHAVAQEMIKANPGLKIKYISAERFISEVMGAVAEDRVAGVRQAYSNLDLLILDDVQYLMQSKVSQEELFHIFNNLHHENRQVILAADRPPSQLTDLNPNILSRLEWGLASDVANPDVGTRVQILKRKQQMQSLSLTEDMLFYVAEKLSSNVRQLEGFLKRIHAQVTLSKKPITMDLVQSIANEVLPQTNGGALPPGATSTNPPGIPSKPTLDGRVPTNGAPPAAKGTPSNVEQLRRILEEAGLQVPGAINAPPTPPPPPPRAPAPPMPAMPPVPPAPPRAAVPPPPPPAPVMPTSMPVPPPAAPMPPVAPPPPPPPPASVMPASIPVPQTAAPNTPPVAPPPPVAAPVPEVAPEPAVDPDDDLPNGYKEIKTVFFYPAGCEEALESVHSKFQDVIKKHKLKFRLKRMHSEGYPFKTKINYAGFVEICKAHKVPVAVVIGPPPEAALHEHQFQEMLAVTLDVQGLSLQLVSWSEIQKDYRYLNLALDIALVRTR